MQAAEALFAKDAVLVLPGGEEVRGRQTIARNFFEGDRRRFTNLEVHEDGDRVVAGFHGVASSTGWPHPLPLRAEFRVARGRITRLDFLTGGLTGT